MMSIGDLQKILSSRCIIIVHRRALRRRVSCMGLSVASCSSYISVNLRFWGLCTLSHLSKHRFKLRVDFYIVYSQKLTIVIGCWLGYWGSCTSSYSRGRNV